MPKLVLLILLGVAAVIVVIGWFSAGQLAPGGERFQQQRASGGEECLSLCRQGCGDLAAAEQELCAAECVAICSETENLEQAP